MSSTYLHQYNLQPSRENNEFVIRIVRERKLYLDQRVEGLRQQLNSSIQIPNEIRTDNALLIQQCLCREGDEANQGNHLNANVNPVQNVNQDNDLTMVRTFMKYG